MAKLYQPWDAVKRCETGHNMGKTVLNTGCQFQCTGNPGILLKAEEGQNQIAKDGSQKILTNQAKCKVMMPGMCLLRPAGTTFLPCQVAISGWLGSESKVKVNGNDILTEKSFSVCNFGGRITPIASAPGKAQMEAVAGITEMERRSGGKKAEQISQAKEHKGQEEVPGDREAKSDGYTMCQYESCGEREGCAYFQAAISVENSSLKLSENFKQERITEWEQYYQKHLQKLEESTEGSWRIAAHHLISGNQVFMMQDAQGILLYGILVKLANYFAYDINNALNCIMLPTNESNFGEKESIVKLAGAYEVMWLMGRQWHVGGHQYSLSKETLLNMSNYYEKHPDQYPAPGNTEFFQNYRMAMKEEMDKLLLKYARSQCWAKNKEKKRQKFIADLNSLSRKVEGYLLKFEKDPRSSFPFFVSRVAVEYAYNLPTAGKIVVVYHSPDGMVHAKKVRLERYRKNELQVIPNEKGDMAVEAGEAGTLEFIRFCENALHFLAEEGVPFTFPFHAEELPGPFVRMVDFGEEKIMSWLSKHGNEMMAFLQQNKQPYQPIAKVVAGRSKGVVLT